MWDRVDVEALLVRVLVAAVAASGLWIAASAGLDWFGQRDAAAGEACLEARTLHAEAEADLSALLTGGGQSVDYLDVARLYDRAITVVEQNPDCFTARERLDAASYRRTLDQADRVTGSVP